MEYLTNIIAFLVAYLVGSIITSIVISKLFKTADPRTFGSKNPGTTNMLRSGNKIASLGTFLGDAFKGWIVVFMALRLVGGNITPLSVTIAAVSVIVGHMWPLYFGFKGGKGVATGLGVIVAFSWKLGLLLFVIWAIILYLTRYVSLASLLVALGATPLSLVFVGDKLYGVAIFIVCVLIIYRHRENIMRLASNRESKIGQKAEDQPPR